MNLDKIELMDSSRIFFGSQVKNNDCGIDLATLHILTKGVSWYNTFGFKSEKHIQEIKDNSEIIVYDLEKFISTILIKSKEESLKFIKDMVFDMKKKFEENKTIDYEVYNPQKTILYAIKSFDDIEKYNDELTLELIKSNDIEFLQKFKLLFSDCVQYKTIQEIMQNINNLYIKNGKIIDCNSEQAEIIKKIIDDASYILTYDRHSLTLTLKN